MVERSPHSNLPNTKPTKSRKPNRLCEYDYSHPGYYFITICAKDRHEWFDKIENCKVVLNDAGKMIHDLWSAIPFHYPGIQIDEFVVMPDHVHGIIIIIDNPVVGTGPCACPNAMHDGRPRRAAPTNRLSLSDVVHRFKSLTTRKYIDGVTRNNWASFDKTLWQRSFYDHVIRGESNLARLREYIVNNPLQWDLDENSPI
ncbi:MAG: transposase [Candidatus Omnitrophica bacterium]|nr:transposase [Candidatus Omnitrophota bacterium]